ncbi:MAG: hypothetical protein IT330_09215 [Anaerolineae bacterium]|nr:hypothetical protein [Anaerolineae bacterium]
MRSRRSVVLSVLIVTLVLLLTACSAVTSNGPSVGQTNPTVRLGPNLLQIVSPQSLTKIVAPASQAEPKVTDPAVRDQAQEMMLQFSPAVQTPAEKVVETQLQNTMPGVETCYPGH